LLPSFSPSFPALHCTALRCGRENHTTDATLSEYISYPPSTRKVPTGYPMKSFFFFFSSKLEHHEGWMISGHETVICWLSTP
jgi:hypothetical protein